MSENSMMAGYAIKMGKVEGDRVDDLFEDFDNSWLNKWQYMYDDSGHECLVYLDNAEYAFYDDLSVCVEFKDMQYMITSAIEFADGLELPLADNGEIALIHFVKVWYNGSEMGSIF